MVSRRDLETYYSIDDMADEMDALEARAEAQVAHQAKLDAKRGR